MSNDEIRDETHLGSSYTMAIFGTDEKHFSLEGTSIEPTKRELALIEALLKHEKWPPVAVYSDCVKMNYLETLRRAAKLVPTDYLSVVEKIGGKHKNKDRTPF